MNNCVSVVLLAIIATSLCSAIPKPPDNEHKNRVVEKELSDEKHFNEDEHNPEYDHEAFLGRDEAETFDDLSPEESQERLGIIYEKIDKDKDGSVTEEELRNWIKHVQNLYIYKDTDRQWAEHEPKGDTLTWEEYKQRTYGFLEEEDNEDNGGYSYMDMMRRDEKRWHKADRDGDGHLSREEFVDFLHPEDAVHMRDIVVEETIDDIDKDKDGFISVEEYIDDIRTYSDDDDEEEDDDDDDDDDDEEEWLERERLDFHNKKDLDGDGLLNFEETRNWILPDGYNHYDEEASHLLIEADVDQDGTLSKEEVMNKYDLFVGSQATDFGEALTRHDEF